MISALDLKDSINKYANEGRDFLFGIDFELSQGFFVGDPNNQSDILWRVGDRSNFSPTTTSNGSYFKPTPLSFDDYTNKFNIVKSGLMNGDSFLTNLTIRTPLETDYTLSEILHRSRSPYAVLIPNKFVCFSPETFVKIEDGIISSNPMKGTISSEVDDARGVILNDYKESAEHYTVVDLIRNDLSIVSTSVNVRRLRYIDTLETSNGSILQVSSDIVGRLDDNYKSRLGDIIFDLLPAGSVSGAPKPSTIDIIKRAEGERRGFYCGIFGYYDGKRLDTAVMIRFIEQDGEQLYFRSGSGVTIHSDAQYEYNEAIQKIYLPF